MREEWNNFKHGIWVKEINVRDFIQQNYTPYEGDDSFLCDATETTKELWAQVMELTKEELAKGAPVLSRRIAKFVLLTRRLASMLT